MRPADRKAILAELRGYAQRGVLGTVNPLIYAQSHGIMAADACELILSVELAWRDEVAA